MKKTAELSALSLEELIEKKKKLKSIYIGISIPMVLACTALIYFAIKSKNYALIAVAMGCSITLMPAFIEMASVNNEIKKRNKSDLIN